MRRYVIGMLMFGLIAFVGCDNPDAPSATAAPKPIGEIKPGQEAPAAGKAPGGKKKGVKDAPSPVAPD